MGRLRPEFIERVEAFSNRVFDVVEVIEKARRNRRVVDQMAGCGTSVAANTNEADEALSRSDFAKTLGIAPKELAETRYWMRFVCGRGWVSPQRMSELQTEADEPRRIMGAMVSKSRASR